MKQKLLLAATVLLMGIAPKAQAYDFAAYNSDWQLLYYNIVDGAAQVTYPGGDYSWTYYGNNNQPHGNLVIPDSVTNNGTTYAVTSIGPYAFYECTGLTSVTIPGTVNCIKYFAFSGCTGLTTVSFSEGLDTIYYFSFQDCSALTSITIPASVKAMSYSFIGCSSLASIAVDSDNTVYDSRNNSNAIIHTASNTLLTGCKNTTIPNDVTAIGSYAFYGCTGLSSITIPDAVWAISDFAFYLCTSLTEITVPRNVTYIGTGSFGGCRHLTSIVVDGYNTVYDSRNNCNAIILTAGDTLIAGCRNTVIPDDIVAIGENAFDNCSDVAFNMSIPNNVTIIGSYAFRNCMLQSVSIGSAVDSIGDMAFAYNGTLENVELRATNPPTHLGETPFANSSSTCTLTVPCGSLSAYSTTSPWSEFSQIVEDCVNEFTVTVVSDDETMGSAIGGGTYETGDEAIITAIANEGYHFVRWQDGDTNAVRTIIVTSDTIFTAHFEANVSISNVDKIAAKIYQRNGQIAVEGCNGESVILFDAVGRQLSVRRNIDGIGVQLDVPTSGVYIIKIGNYPASKIVVEK